MDTLFLIEVNSNVGPHTVGPFLTERSALEVGFTYLDYYLRHLHQRDIKITDYKITEYAVDPIEGLLPIRITYEETRVIGR